MDGAAETLARAQAGDQDAFREIYLAHHAALYRYALGELGSVDDACDVVQEVFIRAWRGLGSFRGETSLLRWLFRITRNLIIDRIRARRRRPEVSLETPLGPDTEDTVGDRIASKRKGPDEATEHAEEMAAFRKALADLPEGQRIVFVLREWEGLDYREIAERLGLNDGTVKSRLARAREALLASMRDATRE